MYEKSLELLNMHKIKLEEGLKYDEIIQIEKIYNIKFPDSLQKFLTLALPISEGFYNWRNNKESNISFLKYTMNEPIEYVSSMAEEVYWCDDWGKEPEDKENLIIEVRKRLKSAPKLIPIFSHRYIPMTLDEDPPIISIHGLDIIYYGKNLEDYFEIEFGNKQQDSILFSDINPIAFWSDIM